MAKFGNLKTNDVSFMRPVTVEAEVLKSNNESDNETDNELEVDQEIEYKILTGQKKQLLLFLVRNRSTGNPSLSGPIMYNDIAKSLKVSKESVPVLLNRLVKTGLVERYKTKFGRTGYAIFKYSPFIRRKFSNLH